MLEVLIFAYILMIHPPIHQSSPQNEGRCHFPRQLGSSPPTPQTTAHQKLLLPQKKNLGLPRHISLARRFPPKDGFSRGVLQLDASCPTTEVTKWLKLVAEATHLKDRPIGSFPQGVRIKKSLSCHHLGTDYQGKPVCHIGFHKRSLLKRSPFF